MRVYTHVCVQARPISINPRSMEAECEYGLPSGKCFTARRLEVVAVAGLLWIYRCVFLVSGGISFFFRFLYLERTRPTTRTRQPCLMYLSTSTETTRTTYDTRYRYTFSYYTETTRTTYDTRYRYHVPGIYTPEYDVEVAVRNRYPDRTAVRKG